MEIQGTRIGACVVLLAALLQGCGSEVGDARFFQNHFYHYETLRLLGNATYGGADIGEVHAVVNQVAVGDADDWYQAWSSMGERLERRADSLSDSTSKGHALFRAHNYYRVAELMLPSAHPSRPAVYERSIEAFNRGLSELEITHEYIKVSYEGGELTAIYYPGKQSDVQRPLVVAGTGFDGTQEEIYFKVAAGALERGYSVLTYEGPGQGAPLRLHGLKFTHEWERPVGAILDAFFVRHDEPEHVVLLGASLGGYLAPRAAAYDERIDGVVSLGVMYDFREASQAMQPTLVRHLSEWLIANGHEKTLEKLMSFRAARDPAFRWALDNAQWTIANDGTLDLVEQQTLFNLSGVAQRITADVLILHGAEDHMIPGHQLEEFESALVNAKSVTSHVYGREAGGHEHCQQGATHLWQEDFFDWMLNKFPEADPTHFISSR